MTKNLKLKVGFKGLVEDKKENYKKKSDKSQINFLKACKKSYINNENNNNGNNASEQKLSFLIQKSYPGEVALIFYVYKTRSPDEVNLYYSVIDGHFVIDFEPLLTVTGQGNGIGYGNV